MRDIGSLFVFLDPGTNHFIIIDKPCLTTTLAVTAAEGLGAASFGAVSLVVYLTFSWTVTLVSTDFLVSATVAAGLGALVSISKNGAPTSTLSPSLAKS